MKLFYKLISVVWTVLLFFSCENFENEFSDYKYTGGYFPYQYPVRTLVLGDYIYDNMNDNAHKFVISVAMGGVYKNKQDREFKVAVDESLCDNLLFSAGGDEVKPLPPSYYTLSSTDRIVIPKGKFNGGVEVQLTDAFFSDPDAIKNTYVVPMKILSADVDSVLPEKDFTLFCVKYINEYHGTYFRSGRSSVKDASGKTIEETNYDNYKFVEDRPRVSLTTTGRWQVSVNVGFNSNKFEGNLVLLLDFDGDKCRVSALNSDFSVSGTGKFQKNAYNWGNKERNGIIVNYTVKDKDGNTYTANDVLVIRDRAVKMEVFSPVTK